MIKVTDYEYIHSSNALLERVDYILKPDNMITKDSYLLEGADDSKDILD